MFSVEEAIQAIQTAAHPLAAETAALADAAGSVLAEDIASDCDVPPHDKSLVDGYAVRTADFQRRPTGEAPSPVELAVVEEVIAGSVPTVPLTAGHATRIMTGAPLPAGADAVVMVEDTSWHAEHGTRLGIVNFQNVSLKVAPEMNIMRQARSIRRGQIVLRAGAPLRAAEIGLLAEVGRRHVRVVQRPRVAVLATGNELVDASLVPAAGQIRNSNGPLLLSWARRLGGVAIDLGIARDDRAALADRIEQGLVADVLLLSGGVSAGVLDLVPEVLKGLGVRELFHKVAVRPGRPLWFGIHDGGPKPTLVFGLPGNPVGSLVCSEIFVAAALRRLQGDLTDGQAPITASLVGEYQQRGARTTYHPARLRNHGSGDIVETVAWHGSGDLRALADANAWAIFPPGERTFLAGEKIACRAMLG